MATKQKAKVEVDSAHPSRSDEIMGVLGELETLVKFNAISLSAEDRLHTGLLTLDMILGGGLTPSMTTFFGPEQSAKTTAALTVLGASVQQNVDLRVLWDAENSSGSSTDYIANIFQTMGVKTTVQELFGERKDGKYVRTPIVYYRDDPEGAKIFDWIHGLQKRLPDKRFEDGRWWYVYEGTKENKAKIKSYHRGMTARNEGIWVPAEDGRLQAIILLDSFPSVLPPSMDEDEADNSIAVQARFFSKQLPRIKGSLRAKRICLLGINQLRINPMARFGNPETEPGGQALRFNSDIRLRFFPRALSSAPFNPKGEKNVEAEPSVTVEGGRDLYRYIHVSAVKNKLSVPGREGWLRIWIQDGDGQAQGYDPVFDTLYYLHTTGQIEGKRHALRLKINGLGDATKTLTWLEFKTLVLGTKEAQAPIWAKIGLRPCRLRVGLRKQIEKGVAETMFMDNLKSRVKAKPDEDEDDGDED